MDVAVVLLVSISESVWNLTLRHRVRWVVVGAIFVLIALFLLFAYVPIDLYELGLINVSYLHARRRLKNGQRPFAYHAWMIPYVCPLSKKRLT